MKKIGLIVIGTLCGLLLGCSVNSYSKQDSPLKIWAENNNGNYYTLKVVDDNTGVNYVVVATELGGGHRALAICPRYNADGTLYSKP